MSQPSAAPDSPTVTARRSVLDRVSVVWLVPICAMVIALGVAWQTYSARGPVITVIFTEATGVAEGETELKYRDVEVGVVEKVGFTDDLQRVAVSIRLEKEVAPFVDQGAVFWVVRPEVSTQGISGLNTVLSGVYIQGSWDADAGGLQLEHEGLDNSPLAQPNEAGRRFILRSDNGLGLGEATPILYRGLEVGRVGEPRLASDGVSIIAEAFIAAPHDRLLTDRSRFWDTSGISFSLGASGASVNFASLTSLLRGGISFDTVVSGGGPPSDSFIFDVFATEEEAEASLFQSATGRRIRVAVLFEDNLPGLAVGAKVTFGGLEVGEVANLTGQVDREQFGDDRVRLLATLSLEFDELAMSAGMVSDEDVFAFLDTQVSSGLRARLANASLLTGGLKVDLVALPDAAPAALDRSDHALPRLPSAPADVADMSQTAEGLLSRVNNLPVEELLASAITFLNNASALVSGPDLNAVPGDVRELVGDIRTVVGAEAFQELPAQLTLVAEDLRGVLEDLRAEDGVVKLVAAVEQAGVAAQAIGTAAEDLPTLLAQIEAVAAKASALDLESLLAESTAVVHDARTLIGGSVAQALPDRLSRALEGVSVAAEEAATLLTDLTEAEAAERLTAAIEGAAVAATQIGAAAEGLPSLLTEIEAVAAKANALPLEDLVDQATGVVTAAQSILGQDSAQALPDSLRTALDGVGAAAGEATELLSELTEAGAAERLTAAIETAAEAAAQIGVAAEGLPNLLTEIEAVAAKANALPLEDLVAQATDVIASAQGLLGSDAAQSVPASLQTALDGVSSAAAEAGTLLADLTASQAAERLTEALAAAGQAASDISEAVGDVPGLVQEIEAVAAKANTLPLEQLVADADGVLASARTILNNENAQALPDRLETALASVDVAVREASVLFADLNGLDSADKLVAAVEAAGQAAADVSLSVADVPELVAEIDRVAARVNTLNIEDLLTEVTALVDSAEKVIGDEAAQALPESLNEALAEVTRVLEELRQGGTVENVNATLASARRAADSVAGAADDLPSLVERTEAVLREAQATIASLGESGQLNREAQVAIREVSRAAEAIRSLARTIERKPNALLTGR